MSPQPTPLAAYGIEDASDTVAYIVFHYISHEERREENTHNGINKVEPVGSCLVERACKQSPYLVDDSMKQQGGNGREETHEQSQEKHKSPLADMFLTPTTEFPKPA